MLCQIGLAEDVQDERRFERECEGRRASRETPAQNLWDRKAPRDPGCVCHWAPAPAPRWELPQTGCAMGESMNGFGIGWYLWADFSMVNVGW